MRSPFASRHVIDRLAARLDGRMAAEERRRVDTHLDECAGCFAAWTQVQAAAAVLAEPQPASLGRAERERLRAAIVQAAQAGPPLKTAPRVPRAWMPWAAAAALVLVGALALKERAPRLEVLPSDDAPTALEETALAVHRGPVAEGSTTYATSSPLEARRWIKAQTGLDMSLALTRPPDEVGRYRIEWARAVTSGGARAAALRYRVDGLPVTLVATRARDARDGAPAWGLLGKSVHHRRSADGLKVLSWTNSGQAYVLVSDLPAMGQQSCLVCHADGRRRRAIQALGD